MHCVWPWDYQSLGHTRIQFHPRKVTPLTNPAKVTDQGLYYCNSDAWGWHNSHQSSHTHSRSACFPESDQLSSVGIGGSVLSVLTQFLSNRSLYVLVDGWRSKLVNVVSGVPQYSVSGPLLFLLYRNFFPFWRISLLVMLTTPLW